MEARAYLNAGDACRKGNFDQDRTHRIGVTAIYELPIGRGKPGGDASGIRNGTDQRLASVWASTSGRAGAPLGFGDAILTGSLHDIALPSGQRTPSEWFNVNAFVTQLRGSAQ